MYFLLLILRKKLTLFLFLSQIAAVDTESFPAITVTRCVTIYSSSDHKLWGETCRFSRFTGKFLELYEDQHFPDNH